jgi:hypothetical protein
MRLTMRSTFIKWLFIVYLFGSGTLYSIGILALFPFVARSGRYRLAAQWRRALVVVMRWLPGITCSTDRDSAASRAAVTAVVGCMTGRRAGIR